MPEKRLIDAYALVDKVRLDWGLTHQSQWISATTKCAAADAMCKLLGEVAKAPTIDAVEVVHGRWEYGVTLNHEWRKCSECLVSQEIFGCFTYCPNCGAKMDGGAEG